MLNDRYVIYVHVGRNQLGEVGYFYMINEMYELYVHVSRNQIHVCD